MTATLNPTGLCGCGCGRKTALAKQTVRRLGHVKGQPVRFIVGHHSATVEGKQRAAENGRNGAKHGQTDSPTYRSWKAMIARCEYPKTRGYRYYGGRGITVCKRWRNSFLAFLEDMGERPEGTSLDRIDSDSNYEPGNCRWATAVEQRANRRDSVAVAG